MKKLNQHSKSTIIIANIVFVCLVVGGYLLLTNNTTKNDIASRESDKVSDSVIQFENIEDKETARDLRSLMPESDEFGGNFEISNNRFKKSSSSLTYIADWQNQAANRIQKYKKGESSRPNNASEIARQAQFFTLIISHVGTTSNPIESMESDLSELPSAIKPFLERNIANKRNLSQVGLDQFSYRLSQATNPNYRDYYNFYQDGYIVKFSMYTSTNDNAFSELIIPKAQLIHQKINSL
jgi:hypothetical protein